MSRLTGNRRRKKKNNTISYLESLEDK